MHLHVHGWGDRDAPPVVCLHGVQAHGRRFRRLAEECLATRFHVLAPDLRGHGRSGWDAPWTLAAHTADLLERFTRPAAWIGHSFGGRLVVEVMATRPDLVRRAVLLDPALVVPPDYAQMLAQDELATDRSFATEDEAVEQTVGELLRPTDDAVADEIREHLLRGNDGRFRFRYSREAVAAAYLEVAAPSPAWEQAGIPTLVVAAAESKFVSVGEADRYRRSLADRFRLVVVPGSHMVLWEAFDETADAIDAFL